MKYVYYKRLENDEEEIAREKKEHEHEEYRRLIDLQTLSLLKDK